VQFPARFDADGKRKMQYFDTRDLALDEIRRVTGDRNEHGVQAVSSGDRHWLNVAKAGLGDLSILPEVIRHWKRTGEKLSPILADEAVPIFISAMQSEFPNHRTFNDIRERLDKFQAHFKGQFVHEISATQIESFLLGISAGWNRWGFHKRIKPFYGFAKRRKWIAVDFMEEIPTPKTPTPEREIYTAKQFENLLYWAELNYPELLPYVVLSGFCFLRNAELVRMYSTEKVLRWENILWSDGLVHVPNGVAKSTRRDEGDERYIPLNDAAKYWLEPIRKAEGDCVPYSAKKFGEVWREMTDKARIERVDNGLRHSAISYALAAFPENGVALTAQWAGNSEKTIRKHYRRLLKPEQGKQWFACKRYFDV
jgi:integrase